MRALLVACAAALVGAATSVATVVLHGVTAGLLLGAAATLTALLALGRAGRVGYAVGWLAVLVLALVPRPAGGWLIGTEWRDWALLALAGVVLGSSVAGAFLPRRGQPGRTPSAT